MTDKYFKRAYQYWNPSKSFDKSKVSFEGGHHDILRHPQTHFEEYMEKDIETAWLNEKVSRV